MPCAFIQNMPNQKDETGNRIDSAIRARVDHLSAIIKIEKELAKDGVKFGQTGEDGVPTFEVGPNYLPNFLHHLEEFEWEVYYKDGTVLRQYDIGGVNHYGNIRQENVKRIRYVSNFEGENDNADRRVVLTLDWETGKFDVLNGQVSPEDRNLLASTGEAGTKKLILFKRVRFGQTMDVGVETPMPTGEVYFYKRYFLGYETEKNKVLICLYPNGRVGIEK